MAKISFEEKLARLKKMAEGPASDDAIREISHALSGANSILTAKAAAIAAKLGLQDLAPDLISAFNRYLKDPAKSDPGCRAKIAAIEALNVLDYPEADVFLRGIRHIQMEYSYGSPVDTADLLRAACAFGLYRLGHPELLCEMVFLLMDREPAARRAAVKVLTESGRESCEMMLRMKALQGDTEPDVLGDCFSGLMAISPVRSLRFVERFLSAEDPGIAEEAALAIGGSRLPEAYALLRDIREREILPSFKRMLLLPIALTRCEEAFTMLLGVVQNERSENAKAAVQALSIYCDNPERREQIRIAVFARNDAVVTQAYENGGKK